jgi:hypothetical protein
MKAIFIAAIAIVAGVTVFPIGAEERSRDGAVGAVVIGSVADGDPGYSRDIARGVNPRDRRFHNDRYQDEPGEGRRNAAR